MRNSRYLILFSIILTACTTQATVSPPTDSPIPIVQSPVIAASATSIPENTTTPSPVPATPTQFTPTPEGQVHFAVIGDYGEAGPNLQAVSNLINSWSPDFIITVGDNNYPLGAAETIDANIGQYFHDFIGNYQGDYGEGSENNRFFPTLGNHDWSAPDAQPYFDYFTLPGNERYYEFTWGAVHFFAIDSDSHEPDGIGQSTIQAQWLREALAASTSPWNIVYMHHAPYSSGTHGDYPPVQWPFAEWGADLVLTGHEHLYERLEIGGIPFIINGLGGSSARYWFGPTRNGSIVRFRDTHGALFIEADNFQLKLQFITINNEVIDTITLTQTP